MPSESGGPAPVLDFSELLLRVDNDREIVGALLEITKKEIPRQLQALRHAANIENVAAVENAGHTLKGMFANISALPASSSAALVEQLARKRQPQLLADAIADLEAECIRLIPALDATLTETQK